MTGRMSCQIITVCMIFFASFALFYQIFNSFSNSPVIITDVGYVVHFVFNGFYIVTVILNAKFRHFTSCFQLSIELHKLN